MALGSRLGSELGSIQGWVQEGKSLRDVLPGLPGPLRATLLPCTALPCPALPCPALPATPIRTQAQALPFAQPASPAPRCRVL